MVSRRSQTSLAQEQPVRFYKFIALTFLLLTLVLLGIVVFMSAKRAEIIISTKAAPVDVTADIVLGQGQTHGIRYEIVTSTLREERVFTPSGTREEVGIANGVVTLHNDGAIDQPLVATTRLQKDDKIFRIKERVLVPAGGTVENVVVYADQEGSNFHIGPARFTIPGLNEAKQKEIYATSDMPMSGGVRQVGVISEDDLVQAKDSLRAYIEKRAAETLAPEASGKKAVYHVIALDTTSDQEVGSEVDQFTLQGNATVAVASYESADMKQWAIDQLKKRSLENTDVIRPSDKEPTVSFVGYDTGRNEATLRVFYDGTVTLSPESKQIEKPVFFGKSKNEVRRYLLSLDHVHSVEVKLHPAWIDAVPHIYDHVSIIVKEVE